MIKEVTGPRRANTRMRRASQKSVVSIGENAFGEILQDDRL